MQCSVIRFNFLCSCSLLFIDQPSSTTCLWTLALKLSAGKCCGAAFDVRKNTRQTHDGGQQDRVGQICY